MISKKLFVYSIGIILMTIILNYILNIAFIDEFYIKRKSNDMIKAVEKIQIFIEQEKNTDLENYIIWLSEEEGISVRIINKPLPNHNISNNSMNGMMMTSKGNGHMGRNNSNPNTVLDVKELPNGFSFIKTRFSETKLLKYDKEISASKKVSLTTSLAVMKSHKHEFNLFNILATIISAGIALLLSFYFSKKIIKDIKKLSLNANKISNLDFPNSSEIILLRSDELGELSRSIDKMNTKLESSVNNLKGFVSNASHELKTPISVLSTYAQALAKEKEISKERLEKYHKNILNVSNKMQNLIENLLMLSKINTPDFSLKRKDTNLKTLVDDVISDNETLELKKQLVITKKNLDVNLNFDYGLFKIALNNLLENSLKYAKESSEISIEYSNNKITITNKLTEQLNDESDKYFQPFYRSSNASTISGHGLGLAIVKNILELHNYDFGIDVSDDSFSFWIIVK